MEPFSGNSLLKACHLKNLSILTGKLSCTKRPGKRRIRYLIFLLIIIVLFIIQPAHGQEVKVAGSVLNVAEELTGTETDPEAAELYFEKLQDLAENPVQINSASENEISRLFFLSDFQVKTLADYVRSYGRIVTIFEVAAIPGFDRETAEEMFPYITFSQKKSNEPDSSRWSNSLISNFSVKPSARDTSSTGSAWKIYSKYAFKAGAFTGGLTVEKDAGEKFLYGKPPMPDFLSANLSYKGEGPVSRIIIGDFSARFGQGTNVNTGIRRGLSLTSPGYMSASDEIRPFTSSEGGRYFRGAAAELKKGNLKLDMFISVKKIDATTEYSDSGELVIRSLYTAGLHNTPLLLQKKAAAAVTTAGINTSYDLKNFKIGITWSHDRFSIPFSQGDELRNQFDFSGKVNNLYSAYYNGFIRNILLYGEITSNNLRKTGIVQGISFRPSDRLYLNFLFRDYDPGFTTFNGNGPGSSSSSNNERGILGSFQFEAAKHLFIGGGFDILSYPWLRYRCSAPARGSRNEITVRFLPSEKLSFEADYSYRMSMIDSTSGEGIKVQNEITSRTLKLTTRFAISDRLTLSSRADFRLVSPASDRGSLLLQDIIYKPGKFAVSIWLRFCIFNTGSWNSRLYTYENDLLYSYSIPALSGQGSRSYLMVKWEINRFAELRIKYGITSSLHETQENDFTDEIKMQFRLRF